MKDLKKLTPFKYFALTNFPYIEADFDALTNYELYSKICEYINEVAENNNNQIDNFNELLQDWNDLKEYIDSYFENLNVQDEVNNRLDEYVEDGTLTNLLAPIVNSIIGNDISGTVTDWLEDNIAQETGYVLDTTLNIRNSAGDSKAIGMQKLPNNIFQKVLNDIINQKEKITKYIITQNDIKFEQGAYSVASSSGSPLQFFDGLTNRLRCVAFFPSFLFSSIYIEVGSGYEYFMAGFSEPNGLNTYRRNWTSNPIEFLTATTRYWVICLRKSDNTDILPSEDTGFKITATINSGVTVDALSNKNVLFMGDSITYGLYSYWDNDERKNSDGLTPDYASITIPDAFKLYTGANVTNLGKRGTGYVADNRNLGNALEIAEDTDFSNYDFVALCYGCNDWIRNIPLGSLEANVINTVAGNLNRVLLKIYHDNPYCKVVIYTPYNTWGQVAVNQDVNYLYGNFESNYALGTNNAENYTLQDLVDLINEIGAFYGVTVCDLNKANLINRINIKDILIDGLHPSEDAMKLLAMEIVSGKDFG